MAKDKTTTTRKKKAVRGPDRPKSAYMYFSAANRVAVSAKNPDVSFGELGQLLGRLWTELPQAEKARYQQQAAADKRRYEAEKGAVDAADD